MDVIMYNQQLEAIKRELTQVGDPIFGQVKDETTTKSQDNVHKAQGVVNLTGGESKGEATVNLNAMKLAANQHRGHSSWIVLCIKLMERGILANPTHNATIRLTSPVPIRYDFIISNLSAGTFERESVVSGVITKGYQSMTVSSDGKHLAAGDSDGNLYIFNLCTSDYTCIQIGYTYRRHMKQKSFP
ncbi:mitogen-activated protein kinase-binding protein 1 [Tanacetum coccineum]